MAELDKIGKSIKDKRFLNWLFIGLMALIELIILGVIVYIMARLIKGPGDELYNLIAMGVLLLWFGILIGYYAWAVYFYNINFGLTNEDWAEIRERKRFDPEGVETPDKNPNEEETFGLPVGTVRGSLALTLMVGGISMTIAGFGMENMVAENAFLVDNFDFFKTAFLMMIAFYFGNKSLEMMGYKSSKTIGRNSGASEDGKTPKTPSPVPPSEDVSKAKELLKQGEISIPVSGAGSHFQQGSDDFDTPGSVQ